MLAYYLRHHEEVDQYVMGQRLKAELARETLRLYSNPELEARIRNRTD
ncbi:MAG TPA: hypothetical protein VFS50_08005 [Meiothermus sp.]|jgi:hypothetical protein|nr:hypothetical protein [Meiothermus sp.]